MPIDYDKLLALKIPEVTQTYTERDAILYALGVGLGHDPMDTDELPFVYEKNLKVLPSFAAVLGWPGFWVRDLDTGIDWVKVVAGDTTMSGIRQGLAALLDGILALMALMFVSTALMVSVLFSAIVTERRGELGLLKAIGARRSQVIGMMVTEAVLATGIGGLLGVVLGVLMMRLFERSLVYYLEKVGVPFVWVDTPRTIAFAAGAIVLASVIGALGVLYPAWRASRRDAYDLVRSEG